MARDDFRNLYQDLLIDHSRERHGYGLVESPSAESHQLNRSCGDEITLRVVAEDGVITSISWEGHGCSISQASASMLCDVASDTSVAEITHIIGAFRSMLHSRGKDGGSEEILGDAVAMSGVSKYPPRINCAMLAWVALEDALQQLGVNQPGELPPPDTTENTQ